ncbi:MAG: hypothetical protein ACK41C_19445 [Phenylobacterium sp.]|jgi:hypothetical protein|uniref:hypothetical protein n=1 Tax=Phenylobacterium sp. TaxID=1871053 RepID=UPI00391C0310
MPTERFTAQPFVRRPGRAEWALQARKQLPAAPSEDPLSAARGLINGILLTLAVALALVLAANLLRSLF